MSVRSRLPLRPGTLRAVIAATFSLACAELIRSGLYLSYLGQSAQAQDALGIAPSVVGLAWALHVGADTVMRGPAGLMIARYGLRPVMIAGALLSLIAMALLLVAQAGWVLLLAAALHGVGFSAAWPGAMNLTADSTAEGAQGRALTAVSMAVLPFIGLGYFLFGFLRDFPVTGVFLLCLGMVGVSLVSAFLLPAHAVRGPDRTPPAPGERRDVLRRLQPLIPAAIMQTVTLSLFGQVLFKLTDVLELPYWTMIAVLVTGALVAFGSLPFVGRVADRGRALLTLTGGFALIGVGMAGIATLPPTWALFPLAALVGLGFAGVQPGWGALVTRTLPEAQRPAAWGFLMTLENIGTAVGPLLGTLAFAQFGARGPFGLGATLALLAAAFYLLFRRAFPASAAPAPAAPSGAASGGPS
ncbi:MFS transporter [Deinococcus indicus]|uniref:MFS transporter n=1 Tax=Deinococcus indicus TaxID=223556 RepID=UPI001994FE4A|nr:MFS transporter [Deinococcus indicus]GHG32453.1 MFS transporter [Deinococcus indicus]